MIFTEANDLLDKSRYWSAKKCSALRKVLLNLMLPCAVTKEVASIKQILHILLNN